MKLALHRFKEGSLRNATLSFYFTIFSVIAFQDFCFEAGFISIFLEKVTRERIIWVLDRRRRRHRRRRRRFHRRRFRRRRLRQ